MKTEVKPRPKPRSIDDDWRHGPPVDVAIDQDDEDRRRAIASVLAQILRPGANLAGMFGVW